MKDKQILCLIWFFFKKGEICHNKRCVIITCAEKENFWKGL